MFSIYSKIYRKIKKYDTIVIARHIGPDPDGLSSQIALRDIILNTFPDKKVYAVGYPASKFKYLGMLDKFKEEMYQNSLLIVVDTPDKKRVDGVDASLFEDSIKIDHHPFMEKFCKTEWIDEDASSAAQMVVELVFKTNLKMTKEAVEKLFVGIVADTHRFLFYYTSSKTFSLVSKLIKATRINFADLYENLYLRSIDELRFHGYVADNMKITENKLAYILISKETLKEYGVDSATARNSVMNFNYIEEMLVWVILTEEEDGEIKGSIRSRGPIINKVANNFNGGGHIYASGVRAVKENQIDDLIEELNKACKDYLKTD